MITDPLFYLAAVPALLITGVSKGGLGGGLGILAVPVIALTVSSTQTAAILLPILCLMDLFGLWAYRRHWEARNLRVLGPASLLGIAAGAGGFHYFEERAIRLLIGLIAVSFILYHWLERGGARPPARPGNPRGWLWGAVSGFTSFLAHAGSPPLQVYLLPQRLDKTLYQGTTVIYFALVNYVKLLPYAWLGQLSADNLTTSLVLSPLAPAGIALGVYLHRRMRPDVFFHVCYVVVFASGLKLLLDGVGLSPL